MIKRLPLSLLVAICLVGLIFSTASAGGKPGFEWYGGAPWNYPVADCSPYGFEGRWIYNQWEEHGHSLTFYNEDGSVDYIAIHASMRHTFTMDGSDRVVSGTGHTRAVRYFPEYLDGFLEIHGAWQRIIIPGIGPIFMDTGHKVFNFVFMPDGSFMIDLIKNAGPSNYTSNDFEALCTYLAGE